MKATKPIELNDLEKRRPIRLFLQWLAKVAFSLLAHLEIEGQENFPEKGPLMMVGNHFSMVDIAAFVRAAPYPVEFIGGAVFANVPGFMSIFPRLWGYLPVHRGTGARFALKQAEKVLNNEGVLAIFPEGGSHARMLRPARPGTAFLATRTRARIIPIGLIGMDEVFESLAKFRRARIRIRIGKPFGPFEVTAKGREKRRQLDEIGDSIMQHIADLIPPEKHGYLSDDPELREAALLEYPWDSQVEGEVEGTNVR
jgi:1-acyl-sn-glycerol-3-phosphate acyltransferase